MIKIAIFDDHPSRRDALRMLLDITSDMQSIGEFENCNHLVEQLSKDIPHVVLMDIDMPGVNGIAGVRLIQQYFPDTYIIMQTVFEDNEKIFESIKAGAHGYILKKEPPDKLIEGIYDVVNGGAPMTSSIARKVIQYFNEKPKTDHKENFNLSQRETQILHHLVKGLSQKMIAAELGISSFTVNNHLKKIYQKLHVHNASEAVSKAIYKRII